MNRRLFLKTATLASGLIVPQAYAGRFAYFGYKSLSNPWGTFVFNSYIPSVFQHNGTWRISAGKLVNEPGLGPELVTNGNFASWTGDNPTSWTMFGTENASNYITESTGAARMVSDGGAIGIGQVILAANNYYKVSLAVSAITNRISLTCGGGTDFRITTTGNHAFTVRATDTSFYVKRESGYSCDAIFDDIAINNIALSNLKFTTNLHTSNASLSSTISTLITGTQCGIIFNYVDESNFAIAYLNGINIIGDECINGVFTQKLTSAQTSTGATLNVNVSPYYSVVVSYNGTPKTPWTLAPALQRGTRWGLFSTDVRDQISSCTISRV